jgi:hypothetical protein
MAPLDPFWPQLQAAMLHGLQAVAGFLLSFCVIGLAISAYQYWRAHHGE